MKHLISMCLMVIVYGSSWCGYCTAVVNELTEMGVPFKEVPHDQRPASLQGISMMPIIVNDYGAVHTGYLDKAALADFLKRGAGSNEDIA